MGDTDPHTVQPEERRMKLPTPSVTVVALGLPAKELMLSWVADRIRSIARGVENIEGKMEGEDSNILTCIGITV